MKKSAEMKAIEKGSKKAIEDMKKKKAPMIAIEIEMGKGKKNGKKKEMCD